MNVLSLFDGISCGRLALERAGIKVNNYFSSEIENKSIKVANDNYPQDIENRLGDVTKIKCDNLPKIDLLLGGSPCTNFSFAGNQKGMIGRGDVQIRSLNQYLDLKRSGYEFEGQSYLFWEYVRILKEIRPKYFLLENNRMKKKFQDVISETVEVEPISINSSLLSAQNRYRLYWTNIPNVVPPEDKKIMLKDIVGEYDGIWVYPRGYNKGGVQSYKGKSPTVTTSSWQYNFFVYQNNKKRKFTVNEVEQLQTLPINYTKSVPETHRYKMIGNGWTVDVIAHILSFLPRGF